MVFVCVFFFFFEFLRVFVHCRFGGFYPPGFQWATEGLGWDPLLKTQTTLCIIIQTTVDG